MPISHKALRATLLAGAALVFLAPSAQAAKKHHDSEIEELKREVRALSAQVEELKGKQGSTAAQPAPVDNSGPSNADLQAQVEDLKRSTSAQYADVQAQQAKQPKATIDNGRLAISSADGKFTAAVRALGQYDSAYYMQSAQALKTGAPDLSSGSNFRRAQLGLQGKVFGDWSYFFNYDFGGSGGTESPGRIQSLFVEYDGLKPFAVRIGAYPPSAGLEDATSSADTIFLERNSPSDAARNIAGGDGRDAVSLLYTGDQFFASLSYTGDKVQDTGIFDEQQSFLGRIADLVYSDDDFKVALSASGTYVFKFGDTSPNDDATRPFTLSDPPEITVDDTGSKLVSTGSLNTQHVTQWALEAGAAYDNFYGQGGYFWYGIDRRVTPPATVAPPNLNFNGWYAQATWVLTGEPKTYNTATASFTSPKPNDPLTLDGLGWGAWEVAGRYSDLNLNDKEGLLGFPVATDPLSGAPVGVRGGDQRIWTVGLNWYPNTVIKFALDYQNIQVSRIGNSSPYGNVGQTVNVVSFRSQISL
jgi:phosphate-selective porin OprO and OprP